ncbi:CAP domain-containing protein [Haloarcula salina]|uniref:CAP domain-containing protein n=1 Tax=Haloarcula salina TaxID=1429914 RepID=UPI003C6EA5F6
MNRWLLALGLVVLAAVSAPLVVGSVADGPTVADSADAAKSAPAATTDAPSTPTEADAAVATPGAADTEEAVATAEAVSTPTSPAQTTPGTGIDEARFEARLVAAINDRRGDPLADDAVDATLATDTKTGQTLSTLARNHSERMAEQGRASPIAGGMDTRDRYAAAGLRDRCRPRHGTNAYFRPVTDLELVTSVDPNGANATRTADAVADYWFDLSGPRDTLYMQNVNHVGVGAATADGVVYVTVVLC